MSRHECSLLGGGQGLELCGSLSDRSVCNKAFGLVESRFAGLRGPHVATSFVAGHLRSL
jgi:hypothetical protein